MDWYLAQCETVLFWLLLKNVFSWPWRGFCSLLRRSYEKLSEMSSSTPRRVVCLCPRMCPCSSLLWLQLWGSALGNTLWSAPVRNGWGIYIFKFGENIHGSKFKKEGKYSEFFAGISTTVCPLKQLIGVPPRCDTDQFALRHGCKAAGQHAQGSSQLKGKMLCDHHAVSQSSIIYALFL